MTAPAIEASALTVHFGEVAGIIDLGLKVERGEIFGFLGPNGSGKTTTIRLLLDLLRPDDGSASLLGIDTREGGGVLRARVGFLPGDLALFPHLNGHQTLRLFARLQGRPPVLADAVLDRLGFRREALDRKVRTWSTGMRQALGITCALQHDPELLILDEPTTGLDPIVRDAFLELLSERRAAGTTVFISSHVLEEIERCADRVGLVMNARLRLVDSVAHLRETRPRSVILRYRDGREERFAHEGDPAALIDGIDGEGLVDVQIRPASLDDVFRAVIREESAEE